MTFLWQFNIIFKKILEYTDSGLGIPLNELCRYINDNSVLRRCDPEQILKLGLSLHLITQDSNKKIYLTDLGSNFFYKSNQKAVNILTEFQNLIVKEIILNNWKSNELNKFIIKIGDNILIYKIHKSKYCATLISMLKTVGLLSESDDEYFFKLSSEFNDKWEKIFQVTTESSEFHYEIQDYYDYWEDVFKGKKFTEKDLKKILENQNKIGKLGEEIAFKFEKNKVSNYENPKLLERVKLIAREYVDKGYDILSVYKDGTPKYIEVKTSKSLNPRFFFSRNEFNKSIEFKGSYWIYYVSLKDRKISLFDNIHKLVNDGILVLEPTLYEVNIPYQVIEQEKLDISDIEFDIED